jgi:hypothetical protein
MDKSKDKRVAKQEKYKGLSMKARHLIFLFVLLACFLHPSRAGQAEEGGGQCPNCCPYGKGGDPEMDIAPHLGDRAEVRGHRCRFHKGSLRCGEQQAEFYGEQINEPAKGRT